jgi:nicotinate phosphoribosyltransferase
MFRKIGVSLMRKFHLASQDEIKSGNTTDIYFIRTREILKEKQLENIKVTMEVTASSLPKKWPWGILCGLDEVANLFEGTPIDIFAMPEGSVFYARDYNYVKEPIIVIQGKYSDFCLLETPLLGLICQASGVATKSARIRKIAGNAQLISFGIRRIHPGLSPMIDRAAYIGGMDGVSSLSGAKTINKKPIGTMPHSLIILFGEQIKAWKAYDEVMPNEVPRIALIDTYYDEKTEAILATEILKDKLYGVRIDTPSSRKGDFEDIIREVRWELNIRGFKDVKIFVSGGLDEENIGSLKKAGVFGFGVGTSISNAPTIDFAMDIVEVEGRPSAKRGKLGGAKQSWRCPECMVDIVRLRDDNSPKCPLCSGSTKPMLVPLIENGQIVADIPEIDSIRKRVLKQISKVNL